MWPAHPQARDGESYTSWLTRVSHANGQDVSRLARALGGETWRVIRHDNDLDPHPDLLARMSSGTGLSVAAQRRLTLERFDDRLHSARLSRHEWILTLGTASRARVRYGQQACVACLAEPDPYLKLEWRVAFITACPRHRMLLIDRCHACGSHLDPVQSPLTQHPFRQCYRCAANLSEGPRVVLSPEAMALEEDARRVLKSGRYAARGRRVTAGEYFAQLYDVVSRIAIRQGKVALTDTPTSTSDRRIASRHHGQKHALATLPPQPRHWLMHHASHLFRPAF